MKCVFHILVALLTTVVVAAPGKLTRGDIGMDSFCTILAYY